MPYFQLLELNLEKVSSVLLENDGIKKKLESKQAGEFQIPLDAFQLCRDHFQNTVSFATSS
jgi:hypothetical protein